LGSWEQVVSKQLRVLGLDSIRNKLLAFGVLATVIPSLSTAWVSYTQNKRSLQAKITGELQSVSQETAREMDLWIKEGLYNLRVFASSYEVSENVDRVSRADSKALRRLNDYLKSVRERFTDYEELIVIDREGRVVAPSTAQTKAVNLPAGWLNSVRADNAALGDPYWDEPLGRVVVIAAVPIRLASGRFVGALTAKVNLRSVDEILKRFAPVAAGQVYLITGKGLVITSSRVTSATPMRTKLLPGMAQALLHREASTLEYRGFEQVAVVGTLRRIPRLHWAVVAEVPVQEAYRQVRRLRNETALIVTALLLGVGLLAYFLGLLIVRPLDRLSQGAAQVSGGDLEVDLPVTSGGEVGFLTEVFNNMVAHLRASRQELEQLSVTDGLTKLYNRRHLMERLANEIHRCRRHKRVVSVVMADVDLFKKYNDSFGHLAGDEALARVATVLREATREVDCAARYGGEEFVLVLPETGVEGAGEVADRIRARLAAEEFQGGKITLSIGIAEFPTHGDAPEAVIASADAAMYDAKREGRNRVTRAGRKQAKETKREQKR
jgi:diguanylate cyclase (GGDEF)-like protein